MAQDGLPGLFRTPPEQLAFRVAALAIGQPYQDPTAIELSPER